MQISQIYLSDAGDQLPAQLQQCVDQVRRLYPEWEHRLYGLGSLREFIADNFDVDVLKAYDKLNPYAYKADLGRVCLLYRLGGWYFDISVRLLTAINPSPDIEVLAYRDRQIHHGKICWACSNSILYSKKGNEVFRLAIEQIVQNCREEYYGITPLCPTGPNLLGRAFAVHGASKDFIFGDLMRLTHRLAVKNVTQAFFPFGLMSLMPWLARRELAFVLPNKVVHAFFKRKGQGAGLSALGAKGTNTYGVLYEAREVYNSIQD
jgi:mannosyltransferase OCH1-like enzyme